MKRTYLVVVSLVMIAIGSLGGIATLSARSAFPAVPPDAYVWVLPEPGAKLDVDAQRAQLDEHRRAASRAGGLRFFAGDEDTRALAWAAERYDKRAGSDETRDLGDALRDVHDGARFHAGVVSILCLVLAACGVLGLLRLRVRGTTVIGGGILVLAMLGGGVILLVTGASGLAWIAILVYLAAFFGQLLGTALLPGRPHPFLVEAEQKLLAVPRSRRARYLATRLIGGAALVVIGAAATIASMAMGGVVVVAWGAVVGGCFMIAMPMIAALRLRAQGRR